MWWRVTDGSHRVLQSLPTHFTGRLRRKWRKVRTSQQIEYLWSLDCWFSKTFLCVCFCVCVVTFALQALAEEALQQAFAELADGGTGVGVDGESVGDFHPTQDHLLHPDGPAAQQGVALHGAQKRALQRGGEQKQKCEEEIGFIFLFMLRFPNREQTDQ